MYVIRVDFPDDDRYAFVTEDNGEVKRFYKRDDAEVASHTFSNAVVIEVNDEGINWWL